MSANKVIEVVVADLDKELGVEEGKGVLNVTLSQQQLSSLCEPLLQRIMTPVREVALMASVLLPGDVGIGATGAAAITSTPQPSSSNAGVPADLDAEVINWKACSPRPHSFLRHPTTSNDCE